MVAVNSVPSRSAAEKSTSEETVQYEAALRRAIDNLSLTLGSGDDYAAVLTATVNAVIPERDRLRNPVLSAMHQHVLVYVSNNIPSTPIPSPSAVEEARKAVLQSLDTFLSVHVIGACAKASAFFDKFIRDTRWFRIALVSGSTVAESAFLAVNAWNGISKSLTIIDVDGSGQETMQRLAWQTQVPVKYAPLSAAYRALDGVDVVVMGAREVMMNGHAIVGHGGAFVTQAAAELGIPLVLTTQAVKYTHNSLVDWATDDGDIIKPREIQAIITELDTNSWRSSCVPDVLKKMAGV